MEQPKKTQVRKMGSIVSQLMSRRGYGQVSATSELQSTISKVVDQQTAPAISVGNLRKGTLQVFVTDSVMLQELNFQKRSILKRLQKDHPESGVLDVRFRIQT